MKTFIKLSALLSERKKNFLLERYKGLSGQELSFLEKADPTDKGDFAEWLLKSLRNNTILLEDSDKTKALLTKFKSLKNSPKFKSLHSIDINSYTPNELWKTIDEGELSKKERYRLRDTQAREFQMGPFTVFRVENTEDAGILGQGTNWCTANNPTLTREYLSQAPLWIAYLDNLPYAQAHGPSEQFMDPSDTPKFFVYDSTYDPGITTPINYVSQGDLKLLGEISKQDATIEEKLYSNMEAKRAPKEMDLETLFKNFSAKEFFLFIKLFEVTERLPEKYEDLLISRTVYPEEREFYFSLFKGPDPKFQDPKRGIDKLWRLDYYTYVVQEPAPAELLGKVNLHDYSYLLHMAMNGDYTALRIGKYEGTYYQVLTKVLDSKTIKYADPEFEKALLYLLNMDEENPDYIKLTARYAVGLKKGVMPELNAAIEAQWVPEIPVLRYIRKYYSDYLNTESGSRYIFAMMENSKERDPLLENMLLYRAGLNKGHRGVARIVIGYLTRFKIKNDEVLSILDGNNSHDYIQYLKAVSEPPEKVLEKFTGHGGWNRGMVMEFVEALESRNDYFEENVRDFYSDMLAPAILAYVHKFKCHLPAEVEECIFNSGEAPAYIKALGQRIAPVIEKRMYTHAQYLFEYVNALNLSLWDVLGNLEEDNLADSGDPFIDLVIEIEMEASRIKSLYFKDFMDYLTKKRSDRIDMIQRAWELVIDNYHNPEEIKRALKRAPLDSTTRSELLSKLD